MRMVLVDILMRKGYQIVGEAPDGQEAVEIYQDLVRQNAEPDIVTMDIDMPKMDGMTAARVILSTRPNANIIMFTSHKEDKLMKEAAALGVKGFITKPADETLILAEFKRVREMSNAPPRPSPAGGAGGKHTVLLVDDSSVIRSMLKDMLVRAGFEVIGQAANGDDAFVLYETLVNERRRPSVVTMDVEMPKVDGVTASRNILARFPDAVIVMFTSKQDEGFFREALKLGVKGFVIKSEIGSAKSDIIPTLQRLLGSAPAAAPAPAGIAVSRMADDLEVVKEEDYATRKEENPEDSLVRSALSSFAHGGAARNPNSAGQPYIPQALINRAPSAPAPAAPGPNGRYKVVCKGIAPGLPVEPTVLRVAEHFKFPPEKARELLSQTSTVKKNLDADNAHTLKNRLAAIGLRAEVVAMEG